MKKLHTQLMYKVIPCLGFFVLGACANFSTETSKVSASNPKANVELATIAPSISSALASVSGAWKPLFVAASPVVEAKADKPVAVVSSASAMPVGSANTTQVVAASSTVTAPMIAPLKMDKSLDSLKYAIYFEYASANLNPTGKAALEYLQGDAKMADAIQVVGRADPSGNPTKNVRLAQARANSVRSELAKYGVNVKNIKVNSLVALAKVDDRVAYKQNLPADLSAASRRADVDMLIKPNVVSKLAVHSNFVSVPG